MISDNYVWLIWSTGFLLIWSIVYMLKPALRKRMLYASVFTTPFGLTEPLFVPEYWNPPSLFQLAQSTGFDIESLIFCFGIGGLGVVGYNLVFRARDEPMPKTDKHLRRHRYHAQVLLTPIYIFLALFFLTSWNPIYIGSVAMFIGAIATLYCRPDLKYKIWYGGLIFLGLYILFLIPLELMFPDYVSQVWAFNQISGIVLLGIPIEELLFGFTFGMLWSSYYEHLAWRRSIPVRR